MPGEHFTAVEKVQGLRKGEKIVVLGQCICVSNEKERLNEIINRPHRDAKPFGVSLRSETEREGFPDMTAKQFVDFFCKEMKCHPVDYVNRIEFRRIS